MAGETERNRWDFIDAESDVLMDLLKEMGDDERSQPWGRVMERLMGVDFDLCQTATTVRDDYRSVRTWLEQGEDWLEQGTMPSDSSLRFNTHQALMAKGRHDRLVRERAFLKNLLEDMGLEDLDERTHQRLNMDKNR